jgi:hypothetical protein
MVDEWLAYSKKDLIHSYCLMIVISNPIMQVTILANFKN